MKTGSTEKNEVAAAVALARSILNPYQPSNTAYQNRDCCWRVAKQVRV